MAGSEVLDKQLGMCFTHFKNNECHKLTSYFMNRTLEVYKHNVEDKQKDSLRNLTTFLQHCKAGKWTDARYSYSTALKEYEYYMKKANEPTAGRREISDRPHSNKDVQEIQLISRSKEASIRLKHNNPDIADLSDPNRPNKLAERFSELYSNEYTDALEELHGTNSIDIESVKSLLKIVKNAYEFCMKQRRKMIDETMQLTGLSTRNNVERYEMMMKLRQTAEEALPNVRQEFMKSLGWSLRARTQRFAEQCVEIVWLMCIQQPPMHLECVENKREMFDPDLYRGYTKSGKFFEFCVWPVVRLHKDGPILTRGIAQGCD